MKLKCRPLPRARPAVAAAWLPSLLYFYSLKCTCLFSVSATTDSKVTPAEIELHDSDEDCWSAIYGQVYDLTDYGSSHRKGGGPGVVWRLCGKDGTSRYDSVHGDHKEWLTEIATIDYVGLLAAPSTSLPEDPSVASSTQGSESADSEAEGHAANALLTLANNETSISSDNIDLIPVGKEELALHNSSGDCWVVYYSVVYNMTEYAYEHPNPPGEIVIHMSCGDDGTEAYANVHPKELLALVEDDIVGNFTASNDEEEASTTTVEKASTARRTVPVPLAEVELHGSMDDCWSEIYGEVYDLTEYGSLHTKGGGPEVVWSLCGREGTSRYDSVHGDHQEWLTEFPEIVHIGPLDPPSTSPPDRLESSTDESEGPEMYIEGQTATPDGLFSSTNNETSTAEKNAFVGSEELALHNTSDDCWVVYHDVVYNMTVYAYEHPNPPGETVIHMSCGDDGTEAYANVHPKELLALVEDDIVGNFSAPNDEDEDSTTTVVESSTARRTVPVSLAEVELHSSMDDCWSAIYGDVYDLTQYGPLHTKGGGPEVVWSLCGKDGSSRYDSVHGDHQEWLTEFSEIVYVGPVDTPSTSPPDTLESSTDESDGPETGIDGQPAPPYGLFSSPDNETSTAEKHGFVGSEELALHNTSDDCWVVYHDVVYNMTEYAYEHPNPPGESVIHMSCGDDGTLAYANVHPKELLALVVDDIVGNYRSVEASIPTTTKQELVSKDELISHNTPEDCWVVYYGVVYNMTEYAHEHPDPPGESVIHMSCGRDGTDAYASAHPKILLALVENEIMGDFMSVEGSTVARAVPDLISSQEVAAHNTPEDCWVIYYDVVYDLTRYAYEHPDPPGSGVIHMSCGYDGTTAYASAHSKDLLLLVQSDIIGNLKHEEAPISVHTESNWILPEELALHVSPQDCWVSYYGVVYHLTEYAEKHPYPPGAGVIHMSCGGDGTEVYEIFHPKEMLLLVQGDIVGSLNSTEENPSVHSKALEPICMEELSLHNIPEDCWVAYYGVVYDLTEYAYQHPNPPGASVIHVSCGTEGTDAYAAVHHEDLLLMVEDYIVGALDLADTVPLSAPSEESILINMKELSTHNTPDDCWVCYYDVVYDLTAYASEHPSPPGDVVIHMSCGEDGTRDYASVHKKDLLALVKDDIVGNLNVTSGASKARSMVYFLLSLGCMALLSFCYL